MIWLLRNIRNRAKFAIRNPGYALDSFLREITFADERFIASITGAPSRRIRHFLDEPATTQDFAEHLRASEKQFRSASIESADLFAKKILNQYVAVRAFAPECIVETGIANGVSSAYLLLALHKNGRGSLHSIGLEDPSFLPDGKSVGWVVPAWLQDRWRVHVGDARQILPSLLSHLGTIDIFIHDSLHTYEHMSWEFEAGYKHIRGGGLLFADDALWNEAFHDFARNVGVSQAHILRGVGFLRKPCGASAEPRVINELGTPDSAAARTD